VVRQRSAKPLFAGSIPARASLNKLLWSTDIASESMLGGNSWNEKKDPRKTPTGRRCRVGAQYGGQSDFAGDTPMPHPLWTDHPGNVDGQSDDRAPPAG
jgi:hypothetical protein